MAMEALTFKRTDNQELDFVAALSWYLGLERFSQMNATGILISSFINIPQDFIIFAMVAIVMLP